MKTSIFQALFVIIDIWLFVSQESQIDKILISGYINLIQN